MIRNKILKFDMIYELDTRLNQLVELYEMKVKAFELGNPHLTKLYRNVDELLTCKCMLNNLIYKLEDYSKVRFL